MPDILQEIYNKICAADSLEQYQAAIAECAEKLETKGLQYAADRIRVLSSVRVNRFSKPATQENFEFSRKEVLAFLKKEKYKDQDIPEEEAVKIVVMIMEHFHDYCRCLYKEKVHKKCSDSLKRICHALKLKMNTMFKDLCIR